MNSRARSLGLLLLLLGFPVIGQEDDRVWFSLSSNATYAPGEAASVWVASEGVQKLEFRLYRVNDAAAFLSQLSDPHSFGNRTAQLPAARTPLERFYRWKRSVRNEIVQYTRRQFTPAARTAWRTRNAEPEAAGQESMSKETAPVAKGTSYAPVQVLNPNQLLKTWTETVNTKQRWQDQEVKVPVEESGLYLIEANDGKLRAYTVLSISPIAVLTRTQPGRAIARVLDRKTGQPLAGADVEFRTGEKVLAKTKTDENGFANFAGQASMPVLTLASRTLNGKTDIAIDSLSEYAINRDEDRRLYTYIYTERPIYRPGHKVFFKAVMRKPVDRGYELPDIKSAEVEVTGADGKPVFRKSINVSRFGTLEGAFELPMTAALGYYSIQIQAGAATGYGGFQVEEYKKPEYEVKIRPSAPRVLQGEKVSATIEARYYFGEPVRDAKVKYTVRMSPYYAAWYEYEEESGYETTEEDNSSRFWYEDQGEEQTGQLDAEGRLNIQLPSKVQERDYMFRIEARVMDEGNREVTGYGAVVATRGDYYLSANTDRYIAQPGQDSTFAITAKDYDGNPRQAAFRAVLESYRYGEDPQNRYRSLSSHEGQTGADGTAKIRVPIPSGDGGSYRLKVTARTAQGRELTAYAYVWASGRYSIANTEEVRIISDKKKYSVGETAKLLLLAPPQANVWITVEHRNILETRAVKPAASGELSFDLPIQAGYLPNVTVTATFIHNGKLMQGRATLRVPPVEKELQLTVTPSKQEFKPGEPARYEVLAKDYQGQPVKAEVSLGVVDEALYAVERETLQTPLSFFYGNVYSDVTASSSLRYYFRGEAGTRAMRLAKLRPSLGQLKPERIGDPRVRKAFPDTAFWVANLVTDSNGRGQVEFAFPDALTMWRATARAFTEDTKVGFVLNRVTVRKNLLIRPVAPRFLTEGDEFRFGVVVQNYLTSGKDVKVSLEASGLELPDGGQQTVRVDAKGLRKVEFRARVKPGTGELDREAVFTAKAITDEESDAVEITLPVKPYGTMLSSGRGGALSNGEKASAKLDAPGNNASLELSVSPSLAGSLLGSLEFLTRFPYGCVEQTMSSFLPNVVVTNALAELGIQSNIKPEELRKKVDSGLERLYGFQQDSGAWGWWRGGDAHPFMTAYVLYGLKQARAAGYPVSQDVLDRAQAWLQREFVRQNQAQPDMRAYIAYALGTKAAADALYDDRARMSPYGRAFLGLLLDELKDARAKAIAQELAAAAQQSESEAWWPANKDTLLDFEADTTPETTSHVLKLLARQSPDSPLLPKAATWLVMHRDQGEWWNSTKQTAMVIYGLIDYLKVSKELKPDFTVRVRVAGKEVLKKSFTAADALNLAPQTLRLPAAAANQIEVEMSGAGRLYWSAQAKYYTPAEQRSTPETAGMTVERSYFRLVPRVKDGLTRYALEPLTGDILPGDAIAVRINANAPNRNYLLIEDPIPAGFEHARESDYNLESRPGWWYFNWAQTEYRDDRAAFFRTYSNDSGRGEYFYILKAVNPGQYRAAPTRMQPMYEPAKVVTGRAATLTVRAQEGQ
jgi:uncharacterized protein YfaS (alpha-2-macroglobulin family)